MLTSRGFSLFLVVAAAALFGLGLLNLVVSTTKPGSWLPLLVLMPWPFLLGLRQLRAHRARGDRG